MLYNKKNICIKLAICIDPCHINQKLPMMSQHLKLSETLSSMADFFFQNFVYCISGVVQCWFSPQYQYTGFSSQQRSEHADEGVRMRVVHISSNSLPVC